MTKEIKTEIDADLYWIGRFKMVKLSLLPILVYEFNTLLQSKLQLCICIHRQSDIQIYMGKEEIRIVKNNFGKE
jgi:hypothetical protein